MNPVTIARVQLVTDEVRQSIKFYAAVRKIDNKIRSGLKPRARAAIRALMDKLLRKPTEDTVGYFLEIHERWWYLVDILKYLEAQMEPWATWKDYFEIIWHKFSSRSFNAQFIQEIYSALEDIPVNDSRLAKEHLRALMSKIIEFEADTQLPLELLRVLDLKFNNVLNVSQVSVELYALRYLRKHPRTVQERLVFLRACGVSWDPVSLRSTGLGTLPRIRPR